MIEILTQHPAASAILAYWLFSALVGGMPDPDAKSSAGYVWLHNSLHILAGNISNAMSARYPALTVPAGSAVEHRETHTTTVVTK